MEAFNDLDWYTDLSRAVFFSKRLHVLFLFMFGFQDKINSKDVKNNANDTSCADNTNDTIGADLSNTTNNTNSNNDIAIIYACATLWHENKDEMKQLLKSIFR